VVETRTYVAAQGQPLAELISFEPQAFKVDDMRTRVPLLRARITQRRADADRARAVLDAQEGPFYRRIGENGFSGGEDLCDISRGASDAARIEAACNDLDDAQERIIAYWVDRAVLDLLSAAGDGPAHAPAAEPFSWPGSYAIAERLLSREAATGTTRCCGVAGAQDRLRLLWIKAEYYARLVAVPAGRARCDCEGEWRQALDSLREAADLAPPYEAPGRFRRIAGEWLRLWAMAGGLFPPDEDHPNFAASMRDHLFADYLAANLGGLNTGAIAPPAPR
jgi:hypothetical protein